jgi:UDP-N-acetyl-D-mannosaminuronate dehydrogenase
MAKKRTLTKRKVSPVTIKQELLEKIAARSARIGIIGLGYVGLPLAVEFARAGFHSIGFEVDPAKADDINHGKSYIPDVPSYLVAGLVASDRLQATTDFAALKDSDIIIICVPTPLRKTKEPDVSYILAAAEKIQAILRAGQLVILESTTYPGTTDEVLRPMFDETGLQLDRDYFLAFSPERIDPGNERFNTRNIPKVVGGVSEASTEVATAAYAEIVDQVHRVSSARVAETCKLLENTFRSVNIGLVNELSQLCYTLGIDTWEVIEAAATKPFGFMPFFPGPGIGGHCLVGDETVIVRSADDASGRVGSLAAIFAEQSADSRARKFAAGGGEVIYRPRLEALSLDTATQLPRWKPVRYLFRRSYAGPLVTITTSDNRRLTATDQHPMLVSDEDGRVRQVFAKDLVIGSRLPVNGPLLAAGVTSVQAEQPITIPVESIDIRSAARQMDVYSVEVDDTHTFATSYGIYVHNCIPLDPHYLSWKARMHGFEARFISLAEEVNSQMPEHVAALVTEGLNRQRKPVNGSRILMLGVAYKRDIDDVRESPALAIIEKLKKLGGEVSYHDPYIPEIKLDGESETMRGIELTQAMLTAADCVVIVTDHRKIDYAWVAEHAALLVDTRNATRGMRAGKLAEKIIRL